MLQNNSYFTLEKILPFTSLRQSIFSTFPIIKLGGVTVYDIGVTGFSSSVVSDLVKVSLVRVLAALFWDQWLRPPLKWLQCHSKGSVAFDLVSGGCRCTGPCDCPAGKETDITYLPSMKTSSGTFWLTVAFVMTTNFLPSVVFSVLIHDKSEQIFCVVLWNWSIVCVFISIEISQQTLSLFCGEFEHSLNIFEQLKSCLALIYTMVCHVVCLDLRIFQPINDIQYISLFIHLKWPIFLNQKNHHSTYCSQLDFIYLIQQLKQCQNFVKNLYIFPSCVKIIRYMWIIIYIS